MNIKQWLTSNKTALVGGTIGVFVCALLFAFYFLVYFPALETNYNEDNRNWLMIPPTITGHIFPFTSHFFVEASPFVGIFCKAKNPSCLGWVAGNVPDCKNPKTIFDDKYGYDKEVAGCCVEKILTVDESCREKVEWAGFVVFSIVLAMVYYNIGALVAKTVRKKHEKKDI